MNNANVITDTSILSIALRNNALDEYVLECRQAAADALDRRLWVNDVFPTIVADLPALVAHDVIRTVKFSGGEKEQSFSYSVWAVTLVPLMVTGYTNTQLIEMQLRSAFPHWDASALSKWTARVFQNYVDGGLLSGKVDEWVGEQRYPRCYLQPKFESLFKTWAAKYSGIKLQPMRVQPDDWTKPTRGIAPELGVKLVQRGARDVMVGKDALKGINAMQRVAFVVNEDIQDIVQDYLDNIHAFQFKSAGQKDANVRLCRKIIDMEPGVRYWLPITVDYRGRMYYRGGELTPQGKDLAKAAFCFAEALPLGRSGHDALLIALANSFGHDKKSFSDRIKWALENVDSLRGLNWFEVSKQASEPFQAYAILCEFNRLAKASCAVEDYVSNLVIHMDGSQNGYQHQAAIIGDRSTAERTNLLEQTGTDTPHDAYVAVLTAVADCADVKESIRTAARVLGRAAVKHPVMTTQYNATVGTFAKHLNDNFRNQLDELGVTAWEMAQAYADAVDKVLPAARALINIYQSRFEKKLESGQIDVISWTLPDGFEVVMQYHDKEWRTIRAGQSAVVLPLADGESDNIDAGKMLRALAANFIQSLDACHMRMVAASCAYPLVGIHDSVGCHAGNYHKVHQLVRQKFIELHSHDVLNDMLRENGVRPANFVARGYEVAESKNALYMFS